MLQTIVTQGWRRIVQAAMGLGLVTLVACGGGGGSAGDSVFPGDGSGGTTSGLTALSITGNPTLPNSSTDPLTLTVTALGAGNSALIGVTTPVEFTVSSGAVVTAGAKTTAATDGKVTATVSLTDKTNRTVTVTATSGSVSQTFKFDVVDSITGSKVADISLVAGSPTLPNDGATTVAITATTLDSLHSAIGAVPLSFSVDDPANSAFVTAAGGATTTNGTTGQLGATLSIGSNKSIRTIKVNATSGTVTRSVAVDVVESTVVTPVAADMTISLGKATVGNSGLNEPVSVVVTAVDSKRNAVSGIDVSFSVDANGVLTVGNSKTAADGTAKATVTIGADRSNRVITVTAKSGSFTRQASFRVTGAKLQATLLPATLKAGDKGQVQYTLTDINSSAMADYAVTITGPGASTGTCVDSNAVTVACITDARGQVTYSYVAAGSGATSINAAAGGVTLTSTVQIDAKLSDVPASTTIASATFTVAPSVVNVNAVGSRDNQAELRLLFLTDKSVPVPNVRVRLGVGANLAGTDGVIGSGTKSTDEMLVTSDANGVAVSNFIAGQRASATDQVKVYACYAKDDSVESISACPDARKLTVSLTVVEQPVSISIGTDNTIADGPNTLTYIQQFTVLVVDAAGNPKPDVQLSPVLDMPSYRKGTWGYSDGLKAWVQTVTVNCLNEDSSPNGFRNGTIEVVNGVSEDVNGNGQLDPRKSDVSVAMVGTTKTDANGTAVLRIEYPKNYGSWTEYAIRVSASGVISPPASFGRIATASGGLIGTAMFTEVPITVVKNEAKPPFQTSPYGTVGSCTSPN